MFFKVILCFNQYSSLFFFYELKLACAKSKKIPAGILIVLLEWINDSGSESLKIAMIRVGVDAGCGGIQGPLFKDGSFEFIPIPENSDMTSKHTFGSLIGRHRKPLSDYFPPRRRENVALMGVHNDPDWTNFTYGTYTGSSQSNLQYLEKGDFLIFTCGLQGWYFDCEPAIYLIGYFKVKTAGRYSDFTRSDIKSLFDDNDHVWRIKSRQEAITEDGRELLLVKGSSKSRLLKKAVRLSITTKDKKGRPLKVLSPRMQKIMGDFGGRISIQRCPARWIDPQYVSRTAEFLQSLK